MLMSSYERIDFEDGHHDLFNWVSTVISAMYQKGKAPPYCCKSSLVDFCETGQLQYTFFWNTFLLFFFAIIWFDGGEFLSVAAVLSKALPPLRALGPWVQGGFPEC